MRLGDRLRASARRARAGHGGGLAGPVLARLGYGARGRADDVAAGAVEHDTPAPAERRDPWEEQPADAYDDSQLAALRSELNTELDRLARPQNIEAPRP